MQRGFPVGPVIATALGIAAVNVLLAQVLVATFYPGARFQLGPGPLLAIAAVAVGCAVAAVLGWRAYLRRRRGR